MRAADGGVGEQEEFSDWHASTLTSYRRFFQEMPTGAIRPEPAALFAAAGAARWVDTTRYWLLPRPGWTQWR